MTNDQRATQPDTSGSDELRGEVALMRAAVEGLAAARERMPDYSPTLAQIVQQVGEANKGIDRIVQSPAARLSPASLVDAIIKASLDVRAEDRRLIAEALDALSHSLGQVDGMIRRGQAADRRLKHLIWSGAGGLLAGILIWSILPGVIARSLPASWQVPEWMAARTIGTSRAVAAHRLMTAPPRNN